MGLSARGARAHPGIRFELPAGWRRQALPETAIADFRPAAGRAGTGLGALIRVDPVLRGIALAREAEAIRSIMASGTDNYAVLRELPTFIAGEEGRLLSLNFKTMDDIEVQRRHYALVRAGEAVFQLIVEGPQARAAEIDAIFERLIASVEFEK